MTTEQIVDKLIALYGENVTRQQILEWTITNGKSKSVTLRNLENYKVGRGKYKLISYLDREKLPFVENNFTLPEFKPMQPEQLSSEAKVISLIPVVDSNFIPFGNYKDVHSVIRSGIFYPVFITGLSGNGKTHSVEQSCAKLKRELIRVNITIETDEDDLLGGMRLESVTTHTVKCDEYTYSKFLEWKNRK